MCIDMNCNLSMDICLAGLIWVTQRIKYLSRSIYLWLAFQYEILFKFQ